MKKLIVFMLCLLILTGCSATETFEQIGDVYAPAVQTDPREIQLQLPVDASSGVFSGGTGRLYFCEGYEIVVETLAGGNLNQTIRNSTGYDMDRITVIEVPQSDDFKRYECVWVTTGEEGEMVGRSVIIDDGAYHYCVCVSALSANAGSLQNTWTELLRSVSV